VVADLAGIKHSIKLPDYNQGPEIINMIEVLDRINLIKPYEFLKIKNRRAQYVSTTGLTIKIQRKNYSNLVGFRSGKPILTAVGIRCADHVTPSIRKSWH
jgi:hypothetical protein